MPKQPQLTAFFGDVRRTAKRRSAGDESAQPPPKRGDMLSVALRAVSKDALSASFRTAIDSGHTPPGVVACDNVLRAEDRAILKEEWSYIDADRAARKEGKQHTYRWKPGKYGFTLDLKPVPLWAKRALFQLKCESGEDFPQPTHCRLTHYGGMDRYPQASGPRKGMPEERPIRKEPRETEVMAVVCLHGHTMATFLPEGSREYNGELARDAERRKLAKDGRTLPYLNSETKQAKKFKVPLNPGSVMLLYGDGLRMWSWGIKPDKQNVVLNSRNKIEGKTARTEAVLAEIWCEKKGGWGRW